MTASTIVIASYLCATSTSVFASDSAPVDDTGRISRITVVTSGTEMVIEQIKAQLDRLVPVHKVSDLTLEGPHLVRELARRNVALPVILISGHADVPMAVAAIKAGAEDFIEKPVSLHAEPSYSPEQYDIVLM